MKTVDTVLGVLLYPVILAGEVETGILVQGWP